MTAHDPTRLPAGQRRAAVAAGPASPAAAARPAAGRRKLKVEDLMAPLGRPIAAVELTDLYRISVVFLAVAMVLLPLVYVALITVVAYGVWYHISHHLWLLGKGYFGILLYLVPAGAGVIGVLFMFKPLFAPPGRRSPHFSLERSKEPVLFAFVDRLCATVGAPPPKRIDVDTEVNASASFRRGFWSLFGDDLVLTIGLPLAAGLTLRQLTGVLAHEFGHFTQGSAMRCNYLVSTTHNWFAQVVFERDAWDEKLVEWCEQAPLGLGAVLYVARFFIWATRSVLWSLMMLSRMLSCFTMRQMEYDADRHEIRVAGSDTFTSTSLELHVLGVALSMAFEDLRNSWMESRLGDDLPALVLANARLARQKPDKLRQFQQAVLDEKTGLFDTHPSTADRIALAHREYTPGIFDVDAPARILFRDFARLCKEATLKTYRQKLELKIDARNLVATASLVAEQNEIQEALQTLYRYFQGEVLGNYEVFLPSEARVPPAHAKQTLQRLRACRQRMLDGLERTVLAVRRLEQADDRMRELATASVALEAGFSFDPQQFRLTSNNMVAVQHARQFAQSERQASIDQLERLVAEARNRLVAGLQLLHVPLVAGRVEGSAQAQARCRSLLVTLEAVERAWPHVLKLREVSNVLTMLLQMIEGNEENGQLFHQILRLSSVATTAMGEVRGALLRVPYPFEHARGKISIADYALEKVPPHEEVVQVLGDTMDLLEKMGNLYYRVLAHLAVTAEKVETAVGLAPLPEPPEEKPADQQAERQALGI